MLFRSALRGDSMTCLFWGSCRVGRCELRVFRLDISRCVKFVVVFALFARTCVCMLCVGVGMCLYECVLVMSLI